MAGNVYVPLEIYVDDTHVESLNGAEYFITITNNGFVAGIYYEGDPTPYDEYTYTYSGNGTFAGIYTSNGTLYTSGQSIPVSGEIIYLYTTNPVEPTSTGKIGNLPIIKKMFGNLPILKEVVNGVVIYEGGDEEDLEELEELTLQLLSTLDVYPLTNYTITYDLAGCSSSNVSDSVIEHSSYSTYLSAYSDLMMRDADIAITMNGVDITNSCYQEDDIVTGEINIPDVTGNIVISVTAVPYNPTETYVKNVTANQIYNYQSGVTTASNPLYADGNNYNIEFNRNGGASAPYLSSSQVRVYKDTELLFELGYGGAGIREIIITCSSSTYMGGISVTRGVATVNQNKSNYTYTITPTGVFNTIGLTNTGGDSGKSTQMRITNIQITYDASIGG